MLSPERFPSDTIAIRAGLQSHYGAAIQQYEGLKYTDDNFDARRLAHILRLGVLPQGYIYPKEERAVRDLVSKRSQLVHRGKSGEPQHRQLDCANRGSKDSMSKKSMNSCLTPILPWRDAQCPQ